MARAPRRLSASAGAADRLELAPPEIPSGDRASAIMRVAYSHLLDDDLLTARALAYQAVELPGAPLTVVEYARGFIDWIDARVAEPDPVVADPYLTVDLRGPRSDETLDPLTELINRQGIRRLAAETLGRNVRCAAIVIDVDRFGRINESYGHQVGDDLLSEIARRIGGAVRSRDVVARWGGDEFVVLMSGVRDQGTTLAVAAAIRDALAEPWTAPDGNQVVVTATMGAAISSPVGTDPDDLLRRADASVERGKNAGKDRVEVWGGGAEDEARQRLEVESMIRAALDNGWFRLYFQPVHSNAPGQPLAAEALLRLVHPELGVLAPGAFLGVAEETGLTKAIGDWVLDESCRIASRWTSSGQPFRFAINVSPRQLDQDLPAAVAEACRRHGIPVDTLTLELTEHALLEADDAQVQVLEAVRAGGVHIALDDFGTAYSSFSHLRRFPVDVVKIDQSFVAGIGSSEKDTAIVRAVVDLSQSFGFRVIAEGVETASQLDQQRRLGCHGAQGFLIGRPRAADQFGELLVTLPMFAQMLTPTLF